MQLYLKMWLRGMLVHVFYFVKIEMYLAAEIIIIYHHFSLEKTTFLFYDNLNHFIVRSHIIKCIRYINARLAEFQFMVDHG